MRYFIWVLACVLFIVGCDSGTNEKMPVSERPLEGLERAELAVFDSWDEAVEFLQWRHLIPVTEQAREETKRDSVVGDVKVKGLSFRIINLDWKGKSRFGIRGRNGPVYIFQQVDDKYKLAGGFLAESADVIVEDGVITAVDRYHISAGEHPSIKYPFKDGKFNDINLQGRGDVFK